MGGKLSLIAILALGILPQFVHARPPHDLKMEFLEVGNDVVGTTIGFLDVSELSEFDTSQNAVVAGGGAVVWEPNPPPNSFPFWYLSMGVERGHVAYTGIHLLPGGGSWFSGPAASIGSFDTGFGISLSDLGFGHLLTVSPYRGTPFWGSSTWTSSTLSSLNLNPGTWIWSYGSSGDTITLQIGPTAGTSSGGGTTGGGGAVPEPGEWAAMGILGAGLTGLVLRKRRKV